MDGYRDDHDDLPLVYLAMNIPSCQLQELTCLSLILICLEVIIGLIEIACPSLLLPIPDHLSRKLYETFSDIDVRIEYIICEEGPPL